MENDGLHSERRKRLRDTLSRPKSTRSWSHSGVHDTISTSVGVWSEQGPRKTNEDAHQVINFNGTSSSVNGGNEGKETKQEHPHTAAFNRTHFRGAYMVCDGHGGDACAAYVSTHLAELVFGHPEFGVDMHQVFADAFDTVEEGWNALAKKEELDGGTTVLFMVLLGAKMYLAYVGDSEAVLCRGEEAVPLVKPHNMKSNAEEEQRVLDAGGRVHHHRIGHPFFNPSIFSIAVTRSIGDAMYKNPEYTGNKPSGLVHQPDVRVEAVSQQDEFVVLACDGLFDVVTYQQAVDLARAFLREDEGGSGRLQRCARMLCERALEEGSSDNVTVLVVLLNHN